MQYSIGYMQIARERKRKARKEQTLAIVGMLIVTAAIIFSGFQPTI